MAELVIQFLGGFNIVRQETELTQFYSNKVRALLAYLAVESHQPHPRAKLAGLLWPENDESRARQSLRQALAQLRKALREKENLPPYIVVTQQTVQWNTEASYSLDTIAFEQAIDTPKGADVALTLYAGDFLDGFFVDEAAEFEEWMLLRREQLRYDALAAYEMAVAQHEHQAEHAEAQRLALRWRALDPLAEGAYQAMMRCAIAQSNFAHALSYYENCAEMLSTELGVSPSAATVQLRNQAQSLQEQPTQSQQTLHEFVVRPSLPVPATPFIGRAQELTEIDNLLFDPACRLLNLIGLGGIGKTRLALEVARRQIVADAFAHGVYWMSLAGTDSILPTLVSGLGLEMPTNTPLIDHIITSVVDLEVLLVLDNLEHVVHEAAILVQLLNAAPRVKILCTSRVRVGVQAEWLWDVTGLGLAQHLSQIEAAESYQLFVQSARRAQAKFIPQPDDQEYIARICELVDGHPLSISLAAAWVRVFTCEEVWAELSTNLGLLASTENDVAERHRSVQLIFDHTWQTLLAEEKAGLQKLSVFSGPFSRKAVFEVTELSASTLMQLVDHALVQRQDEFFTLHPVIRHFAAAKLADDEAAARAIRSAHSRYHLAFLDAQLGRPRGMEQPRAQQYVRELLDDIHQAWRWALSQQSVPDVLLALNPLYTFYETSGWYAIGAQEFQTASLLASEWSKEQVTGDARQLERLEVSLLACEAVFRYRLGELSEAGSMLSSAIAQQKSLPQDPNTTEPEELAFVYRWYGAVLHELGEYDEAKQKFDFAHTIYEQMGNAQGLAHVLRELADLLYFVDGKPEESLLLYEESLGAAQTAKDRTAEILAFLNSGTAYISLGDYIRAEENLQESLRMSRELGAKRLIGVTLNNLAIIAYEEDPKKAQQLMEENYAIRVEIGDRLGQANCLRHMAENAGALGDFAQMCELAEQAGRIYRVANNQRGIISGYCLRTIGHARLGELDVGQRLLARAVENCAQLESTNAWFSAALSGMQLAVAQRNDEIALLLAGHLLNSSAAHSYERRAAQEALARLQQEMTGRLPSEREDKFLQIGADASIEQIQGWLGTVSQREQSLSTKVRDEVVR